MESVRLYHSSCCVRQEHGVYLPKRASKLCVCNINATHFASGVSPGEAVPCVPRVLPLLRYKSVESVRQGQQRLDSACAHRDTNRPAAHPSPPHTERINPKRCGIQHQVSGMCRSSLCNVRYSNTGVMEFVEGMLRMPVTLCAMYAFSKVRHPHA